MPTAVSGNTSHVTGTYKGGSGTYKFLPMTSAGDAAAADVRGPGYNRGLYQTFGFAVLNAFGVTADPS